MDVSDEIRTRYRLAVPTFANICKISPRPDRRAIFKAAIDAAEFQSFTIRAGERAWLRHVNEHTNIPYPIKEPITEPWQKVSLLVQIDLSGQPWPSKLSQSSRKELHGDGKRVYRILDQVLRCIIDLLGHRGDGRGVSVGLDVLRSVHAKVWEGAGGGVELLQVDGIGTVRLRKFSDAGVRTVRKLAGMEFYHIERLTSRNPPYGQNMLRQLSGFPLLTLHVESMGEERRAKANSTESGSGVLSDSLWVVRVVMGFENKLLPVWKNKSPWVSCVMEGRELKDDGKLFWFWRGSVKRLDGDGGKEVFVGVPGHKGCKLRVTLACEVLVGTMVQIDFEL